MALFKRGISRKFVFFISSVFLLSILLIAVSFRYVISENAGLVRSLLMSSSEELLLERTGAIMEKMKGAHYRGAADFTAALKRASLAEPSILHVLVFARTADDDYYRVLDKVPLNAAFRVEAEVKSVVSIEGENEYLKRGVYAAAVDPSVYASGAFTWRNVYHPFNLNRRNLVVGFMASAGRTASALADYDRSISGVKRNVIIINVAAALLVLLAVGLFIQNYSLFLKNLAGYFGRASRGDLAVNISAPDDDEMQELAASFNGLIEEMRVLKEREKAVSERAAEEKISAGKLSDERAADKKAADERAAEARAAEEKIAAGNIADEKDPVDDMFRMGVQKLKDGNLEDAVHVFRALQLMRPESFGSYFNLGVAYAKMRSYDASLEMFDRALELNPAHELAKGYIDKVKQLKERYDPGPAQHNVQA